jgi:splicing factor 3A subunit 3
MRALGIPNTKEFLDVTAIEDARALWATIRGRVGGGAAGGGGGPPGAGGAAAAAVAVGMDEEVEDAEGNVYTRKVYDDLKRQGLI